MMTEPAEEARTRQGLYRFTSVALKPPDLDTWHQLSAAAVALSDRDLSGLAYSPEWVELANSIGDHPPYVGLESEYVRLFGVGPTSTPAPPFESFYRVPKREGGSGEFVSGLAAEYRRMGIRLSVGSEPPDHISGEMEAMSVLCRLESEAWESNNSDGVETVLRFQRSFLDRHLAVWVPVFARKARSARPAEVYSLLIVFLHAFVIHERNLASLRVAAVGAR